MHMVNLFTRTHMYILAPREIFFLPRVYWEHMVNLYTHIHVYTFTFTRHSFVNFGSVNESTLLLARNTSCMSPTVFRLHTTSRNVWSTPDPPLFCLAPFNIGNGNIL